MKTTLLITTFNRGHLLWYSLERLEQSILPDEVLVIDDGGTDHTQAVCEEFNGRLPIPVRYVYNNNPGHTLCSKARNIGLKLASHDLIVTSEPEIMFESQVIEQLRQRHVEEPTKVISAGLVYAAREESQRTPEGCEWREGWVAPYTALYHRDWLMEIGGWDEDMPGMWGWDDTDLLSRLRFAGHGQVIDKEIHVLHQWHPEPPDVDGGPNEAHFRAKSFHENPEDPSDLIANKGRPWGVLSQPTKN